MINISFSVSKKNCARRDKTTKSSVSTHGKVPYLFVFRALFCPYLHKDKATKQITAFGLFGTAFLRNTAKPLFFLNSFIVSVFNAHRKKRE